MARAYRLPLLWLDWSGARVASVEASLLPPDDPARIDLVPTVRVAQGLGGDLGWAVDVLDEAIAAGDDQVRAHALVQRGLLRLFTGPDVAAGELIEIAERAIEDLQGHEHELGLARAWRLVAQANYLARRAGPSVAAAKRALAHARRADDPFEEREIVQYLLVALVLGPAPAPEAARVCEQLLEEAASNPVLGQRRRGRQGARPAGSAWAAEAGNGWAGLRPAHVLYDCIASVRRSPPAFGRAGWPARRLRDPRPRA